jgi:hypothetical protein
MAQGKTGPLVSQSQGKTFRQSEQQAQRRPATIQDQGFHKCAGRFEETAYTGHNPMARKTRRICIGYPGVEKE